MCKISVLMPVYNTPKDFLKEAIDSILNQTFKDFEFLIINDGSTNNAEDIILSYEDKRIKYIKNEKNLGLIDTLNKGIELAQGEYIARFDSDDISLPERLEKQYNYMINNPQVGVLGTQYESFPKRKVSNLATKNDTIKEILLLDSNTIGHPTVMIKKSILLDNNVRYDKQALYVEDYKMWLDLIDKTEFANLEDILLKYRRHNESICKQNSQKQNINVQKIMFEAQAKYFNINANTIVEIIERLKNNQKIKTNDLLEISNFANEIKKLAQQKNFSTEYKLNHIFSKFILKKCEKDFLYFKLYLSKKLNLFFEK